jgi:hypothetical protein
VNVERHKIVGNDADVSVAMEAGARKQRVNKIECEPFPAALSPANTPLPSYVDAINFRTCYHMDCFPVLS